MMNNLYLEMKEKGIDMSWYERGKKGENGIIPLDDQECSNLSIYYLKKDSSLWTVTSSGKPHHQIRPVGRSLPRSIYLCLHCKMQWNDPPLDKEGAVTHRGSE